MDLYNIPIDVKGEFGPTPKEALESAKQRILELERMLMKDKWFPLDNNRWINMEFIEYVDDKHKEIGMTSGEVIGLSPHLMQKLKAFLIL